MSADPLSSPATRRFVAEVAAEWERQHPRHIGGGSPIESFGEYLLAALTNPRITLAGEVLDDIMVTREKRAEVGG